MSILQEYENIKRKLGDKKYNQILLFLKHHPKYSLSDVYYNADVYGEFEKWIKYHDKKISTIKSVYGYSLVNNAIIVELVGYDGLYYINPKELHFGGENCEISTLTANSKIEHNEYINVKTRDITDITILSDGVKEVDNEKNLIK